MANTRIQNVSRRLLRATSAVWDRQCRSSPSLVFMILMAAGSRFLPCESFFCPRLPPLAVTGPRSQESTAARRRATSAHMQILPEGGQSPCNIKVRFLPTYTALPRYPLSPTKKRIEECMLNSSGCSTYNLRVDGFGVKASRLFQKAVWVLLVLSH